MKGVRVLLLCGACAAMAHAANGAEQWVATWGASPAPQMADATAMREHKLIFEDETVREIVHVSAGGAAVRIRLSNAYGKKTVEIGAVHVALRSSDSGIVAGSDRAVTFGGRASVAIPADAPLLSDPVELRVAAGGELAISLYVAHAEGAGIHYSAQQKQYIGRGNQVSAAAIANPVSVASWVFLAGVDVRASEAAARTVVAFGDSITDGAASTMDANRRWPDVLAARLAGNEGTRDVAVVDAGIGGNRILHDAGAANIGFGLNGLARFERDALGVPGARYVIVLEGINDIGHAGTSAPVSETVSAEDLIGGLKQMIERAHEHGLKIFGGTLTPFEGTVFPGYFSPEKEVKRKAVNAWIRTGGAFDGVIDFEKAVADPQHPDRMLAAYDSGDHLHPNDAGYKTMGEAVDLALFR